MHIYIYTQLHQLRDHALLAPHASRLANGSS